jgi:hypothetical protein
LFFLFLSSFFFERDRLGEELRPREQYRVLDFGWFGLVPLLFDTAGKRSDFPYSRGLQEEERRREPTHQRIQS